LVNEKGTHALQHVQQLLAEALRVVYQRDRGEARLACQLVRATQLPTTLGDLTLRVLKAIKS